MSCVAPEWIEYQRRRFMRPDAQRYWRPDADRLVPRETLKALGWQEPRDAERRRDAAADFRASVVAVLAERAELMALKSLATELKWQLALRNFARKYRPDQPRDDRGRWTDAGGASFSDHTDFSAVRRDRAKGHH